MEKDYIVNCDTLAIIGLHQNITKIVEKNCEWIVNQSTYSIIDNSCKYFGSSLKGRQEATKYLLGINYKLPILLEESHELIYFPTSSPETSMCNWICLNYIEEYSRQGQNSLILFQENIPLLLDISFGSFENQFFRATKLLFTIKKNKNR